MLNCSVFKTTSDDWYPSYKLSNWYKGVQNKKLVEVSFIRLSIGEWLVCVWGNDDYGLEKEFSTEVVAWSTFLEIIGLEDVTIDAVLEKGFIGA